MLRLVPFVVLAVVGEAAAQPGATPYTRDLDDPAAPPAPPVPAPHVETGFIGGGFILGGDQFIDAALAVEGGLRLGSNGLWLRGLFARGSAFDFEGGGNLTRAMIGLEYRGCSRQSFCGFVALDVGYQQQTWAGDDPDSMTEHHDGLLVGPRIGLDAGGDNLRFRFAFEATRYDHHAVTSAGESTSWQGGGGFTMTLVYRL
jgi:hypothetical protein